jgi:hypothetical protein
MKFFKIIILGLGVIAVSSIVLSCTKTVPHLAATETDFSTSVQVQIFNATVKSTRNYVYVDAIPVSGAAFAFGAAFPSSAFAFRVNGGMRSFLIKDTLKTSTQVPLAFVENFTSNKSYTIFMYDTTTSVKQVTVLNNIVVPTDTTARLRFANFIYNNGIIGPVDVYSFRRGTATPVFTNVGVTQVTDFIPYASGSTDSLYVYATGTTSPLLVKASIPGFVPTRSYTAVFNGSYKGTRAITAFATY